VQQPSSSGARRVLLTHITCSPQFWRDVDYEELFCWSVSVLSTSFAMAEEQRTLVLSPEDLQAIITGVASSPALISGIADHLHSRNLIPPPPQASEQPSHSANEEGSGSNPTVQTVHRHDSQHQGEPAQY